MVNGPQKHHNDENDPRMMDGQESGRACSFLAGHMRSESGGGESE